MDSNLGFEATGSSKDKSLSKRIHQFSSKRDSIGVMLVSEISGDKKEFSY